MAVVTAVILGVGLFEPYFETRFGDGGLIEVLAAPVDETKPFGPPLLLATLFALLGPARPWHRLAARVIAGIALCGALYWLALDYAFTERFNMPRDEDAVIQFGLVAITALSALWGFSGDRRPAAAEEQP